MPRAPDAKPKPTVVVYFTQCAVVVVSSSAARVCGHSQLCDSSRHLLLRLLQRASWSDAYLHSLAGWLADWLLRLAALKQRTKICGFGALPRTEATKLAPTRMTAAAHHAVVNKFLFSFLAPPFFFLFFSFFFGFLGAKNFHLKCKFVEKV